MSAFTRSTFTINRSLVYMSIDGKKSIFPDGTLIFWNSVLKMVKNRILLKYSGKNHTFLIKTFEKYLLLNHEKSLFLNFDLVHVDVKLLEDSESDLIFCNFWCKSGQKHGFIPNFPISECIEIYPNLAINHRFWPLLRDKIEKIRSDSESSCNFTSTCTKSKSENDDFSWF